MIPQGRQSNSSSMKRYLKDIDSNTRQNRELMIHEWARFESFNNFPKSCRVSCLRLAKSGFYYAGIGERAICFCCGVSNDLWNTTESVHEIHKILSPNCKFVKGEETRNVPIHVNDVQTQLNHSIEGASGGPLDIQNATNRLSGNCVTEKSEHRDALHSSEERFNQGRKQEASLEERKTHDDRRLANTLAGRVNKQPQEDRGVANKSASRITEQPKHPDYATKGARMASYTGWPSTNIVQAEELSIAGFFYAGITDCVRCFNCGGGIKNWEYGDSPWIEHARWFPNCAYVKQCKGVDFVETCKEAGEEETSTQRSEVTQYQHSRQPNITEDTYNEDSKSTAVMHVLEMGYSRAQIEDAMKKVRLKHVGANLDANVLLEFLLDNNCMSADFPSLIEKHGNKLDTPVPPKPDAKEASSKPAVTKSSDERQSQLLYDENQQLREQMMCKICMDKDACIVFLPCGHMTACVDCAHALRKCAICRKIIQRTVRINRS